jgi:magnesium-transporting ATPase (P-type)
MAAKTGLVEFIDRNSTFFKIKVQGVIEEYKTIKFFDFTSARKMMTRVVQNTETGKVMAISKGADSAILSRCVPRKLIKANHGARSVKDQGKLDDFDAEEHDIVEKIELFAA